MVGLTPSMIVNGIQIARGCTAEGDRRFAGEFLGKVEHGGDADSAADEDGELIGLGESEAVAEGAEDIDAVSDFQISKPSSADADDAVDDL